MACLKRFHQNSKDSTSTKDSDPKAEMYLLHMKDTTVRGYLDRIIEDANAVVQSGNEIVMIPTVTSLLVLRPCGRSEHKVIAPAFVPGKEQLIISGKGREAIYLK